MGGSEPTYFQKGFNLRKVVGPVLAASYHSTVVDRLREMGYAVRAGDVEVKLAREFGFCYGVDRAVDYAYQTRKRFPNRRVFLTGEIIHNRHVNDRLRSQDIRILTDPGEQRAALGPDDVVILPAFGVSIQELADLERQGCTLVDTTCGSVLNVWKNVVRYAREGFTAVIHGKVKHEETRATASQALRETFGSDGQPEMTGDYQLLLPTMWVSTLCFLLCRRWKLYHKQVPGRLDSPAHRAVHHDRYPAEEDRSPDLLPSHHSDRPDRYPRPEGCRSDPEIPDHYQIDSK